MLFAEPGHPYDDFDNPPEWVWRYGYMALIYDRGAKTLTLRRGPKYSVHSRRCCKECDGSGYLPWWENPTERADNPVLCPTCPARRTLFEHVPLWPVRALDALRDRRFKRRRSLGDPNAWDNPQQSPTDGYSDEPPF
ncbi:hypothetical protein [Streptomyces sp. NPDC007088]|uniref:hypothetical protein n=1 Tax=Streptomyces sp. NPDC007088 TaxID=3364773 RepID=UPI0036C21A61